jgi:hypothetical protein
VEQQSLRQRLPAWTWVLCNLSPAGDVTHAGEGHVKRHIAAVAGVCVLSAGACTSDAVTGAPATFGEPEHAGLCEGMNADVGSDSVGTPTRREAVDKFQTRMDVLEPTTIAGDDIIFRGRVVGSVDVQRAPAGGWYVAAAEWCYPERPLPGFLNLD